MSTIEQSIQERFLSNGWTLSTAESCTGGAISARLTKNAGASLYFVGGVVAYSNLMKQTMLGVPPELIDRQGAVSREVVASMAKGVLALSQSDYALAVSGIAGPTGGTEQKPVGTIWAAIAKKGEEPACWTFIVKGSREQVIQGACDQILNALYRSLK